MLLRFFAARKAFQKTKLQTATSPETSPSPKLQFKNQFSIVATECCNWVAPHGPSGALTCVEWTHSLAERGSQLCSPPAEEIKHIRLPSLLTADRTRNASQKNWNMSSLGMGYSHFSLAWY